MEEICENHFNGHSTNLTFYINLFVLLAATYLCKITYKKDRYYYGPFCLQLFMGDGLILNESTSNTWFLHLRSRVRQYYFGYF